MHDNNPKGVSGFINNYLETESLNLEYVSYKEFRSMIIAFINECKPSLNVFSSFLQGLSSKVSPGGGRVLRSHLRVFSKELYTNPSIFT